MAFVLDPGVPLVDAVAQVLRDQADAAVAALGGADLAVGVHEARKASKRSRALLLAVGAPRAEIERCRDAAAAIGDARDAVVRRETFAEVFGGVYPGEGALQVVVAPEALDRARALLSAVPAAFEPALLAIGITDGYRRARRAFPQDDESSAEEIHAWRKRVKIHMFQLRLLTPRWPGLLHALVDELDNLGEALGKHHDLAMLRASLARDGHLTETMATTLDARMAGRWGYARLAGERLFAVPTRGFAKWAAAVVG